MDPTTLKMPASFSGGSLTEDQMVAEQNRYKTSKMIKKSYMQSKCLEDLFEKSKPTQVTKANNEKLWKGMNLLYDTVLNGSATKLAAQCESVLVYMYI